MSRRPKGSGVAARTSSKPAIEATLWAAADKLRGNMDAAEYKHVALGLIFLKYISDRFDERRAQAEADPEERDLVEERDLYLGDNVFWVPAEARWTFLKENATSVDPSIGSLIDRAMIALETENPSLKGVLTKNYARPELDQIRLGEVVKLFSDLAFKDAHHGQDMLGRVYEYFLGQFAIAEGKRGGQFYTAGCIVRLLVEMIQPFKGRVYDPCCGSGGMFVQSERFVEAHSTQYVDPVKAKRELSIFGQESNPTTWRLAKMNLAIRGIEADLGPKWADSFLEDLHPGLKADFVLANPPFNDSDWGGERARTGQSWPYGVPPAGNANFAWVQLFIRHLAPHGVAGFVLANGSLSSQQSGEGDIRRAIIEADLVDCIVSLPGQLFSTTQIPVCLWFLARDKSNGLVKDKTLRDRRRETLFIDARGLGTMQSRTLKVLSEADIAKVADTYHAWREKGGRYVDEPGFSSMATTAEIAGKCYVLTPGRYVGTVAADEEDETFDAKMQRLTATLREQMAEGAKLDERIRSALAGVGYGW
ncbi:type I restriction-modification system subunit M [Komagataeibacter medellinensis]|uniref:site-specific DNA-methyltransferase (adenine-specific) n=1 Tax=Komagataeibacter medellinensis (strain NBRC 3288 / BCRC 11682 / LMG 1693 / Kondo 51) TaxID=634177 RepID=G2I139_KOMMN|nr:class I SAM-dependent DNA methyltransferase [Komagataeibacter medellinensis]BAK84647.1 type I DNA methyltransferase M subunit [Komagataeibacter medellinensis NBRC 3288]